MAEHETEADSSMTETHVHDTTPALQLAAQLPHALDTLGIPMRAGDREIWRTLVLEMLAQDVQELPISGREAATRAGIDRTRTGFEALRRLTEAGLLRLTVEGDNNSPHVYALDSKRVREITELAGRIKILRKELS